MPSFGGVEVEVWVRRRRREEGGVNPPLQLSPHAAAPRRLLLLFLLRDGGDTSDGGWRRRMKSRRREFASQDFLRRVLISPTIKETAVTWLRPERSLSPDSCRMTNCRLVTRIRRGKLTSQQNYFIHRWLQIDWERIVKPGRADFVQWRKLDRVASRGNFPKLFTFTSV